MKILQPDNNGFCSGVKRAVDMAFAAAGPDVYCFGEIVHNPKVVAALAERGVTIQKDITKLKRGDTLIITAHGASKKVFEYCGRSGIKIIDTTCPFVRVLHEKAARYHEKGYKIVLIGNKNHPEIIGVNGWCNDDALITDGQISVDINGFDKVFVMFQTTYNVENVDSALENLKADNVKTLEIFNTICYTTTERQKNAADISSRCDSVIVVGGKNSSNTGRLLEICKKNCPHTVAIESPDELFDFDFSNTENLGIIAGASTPSELIEEVVAKMAEQTKDNIIETNAENEMFKNAVENFHRKSLRKGQKLKGRIAHIDNSGIIINFDFQKKEGFIPNEEITLDEDYNQAKANLKVGDTLEVIVLLADKDIILSHKAIEELYKDDALVEGIKQGNEFSVTATKEVKGGLLSKLGSYTVFIPASQIRSGYVKDLSKYVGKKLRLVALPDGVDDSKKKIVASQKSVLEAEKKAREDNFWENIEVGEIVEGQVVRFASFGAFVNVRGFDCLAHISDLSWTPIKEPSEVLELNKTYEFVVLKLDREANRVSIGYKQLLPDPWQVAFEKHPVGSVTKGKVARILPFGAFVEIEPGVDGLLHVSNVSWEWVDDIKKVLKVGDEIDVAITEFNPESKRVTLSRKATMEQPQDASENK